MEEYCDMKGGAYDLKILLDSDGFFWPSDISEEYMKKEREFISFEEMKDNHYDVFEQYYLGFRSSLFICEDTIRNQKDKKEADRVLTEFRNGCVGSALAYMKNHIDSGPPLPVDFLWNIRDFIVNFLKKKYANVEKIELKLTMQPKFSARTVNQNTIIIPALTRTILLQCNMALINSIYDFTEGFDESKMKDFSMKTESNANSVLDYNFKQTVQNARHIFPYLLYCHDNVSVMNLPMRGARSQDVVEYVLQFTNIQLAFIIAHEYAHILLNHFNDNRDRYVKENEADSFAIKVLLAFVEKYYSKEDLLISIRWLFKYQLIEQKLGELVQGQKVIGFDSNYEKRRGKCQYELLTKFKQGGCSIFETIGFCMLVDLQKILYDMGEELIDDILKAFEKSKKTGGVEPWWEKIAQE